MGSVPFWGVLGGARWRGPEALVAGSEGGAEALVRLGPHASAGAVFQVADVALGDFDQVSQVGAAHPRLHALLADRVPVDLEGRRLVHALNLALVSLGV